MIYLNCTIAHSLFLRYFCHKCSVWTHDTHNSGLLLKSLILHLNKHIKKKTHFWGNCKKEKVFPHIYLSLPFAFFLKQFIKVALTYLRSCTYLICNMMSLKISMYPSIYENHQYNLFCKYIHCLLLKVSSCLLYASWRVQEVTLQGLRFGVL